MIGQFGYLLAFSTGILGALHCLGMCSGINGGFFAGYRQSPKILSLLAFHGARIATYGVLGIVGALIGRTIVQVGIFGKVQGVLMIIAGILVILIGLYLLGLFGFISKKKTQSGQAEVHTISFSDPSIIDKKSKKTQTARIAPFIAGLFNGLVPCSLVFSVAIKASATADPMQAGLLMLAFGAGTLPTMGMVSVTGALIGAQSHQLIARLAAISVILLGVWTLYEGVIFYDIMRGLSN